MILQVMITALVILAQEEFQNMEHFLKATERRSWSGVGHLWQQIWRSDLRSEAEKESMKEQAVMQAL